MKKVILAIGLILLFASNISAETWKLGSHEASLDISVPANYSLTTPIYYADFQGWQYGLNITLDKGFLAVNVVELAAPQYGDIIQTIAENRIAGAKLSGIGGYRYSMIDYKGKDAFEEFFPAQEVHMSGGQYLPPGPDIYRLNYMLDSQTFIMVSSHGAGEAPYRELLNSLNITDSKE